MVSKFPTQYNSQNVVPKLLPFKFKSVMSLIKLMPFATHLFTSSLSRCSFCNFWWKLAVNFQLSTGYFQFSSLSTLFLDQDHLNQKSVLSPGHLAAASLIYFTFRVLCQRGANSNTCAEGGLLGLIPTKI